MVVLVIVVTVMVMVLVIMVLVIGLVYSDGVDEVVLMAFMLLVIRLVNTQRR